MLQPRLGAMSTCPECRTDWRTMKAEAVTIARYAIIDAARDYMRIGVSRLCSPESSNMFRGDKGKRLDSVAPHLFECDVKGTIFHMVASGEPPGEIGVVIDSAGDFTTVYRHLRRFLTVVRERDQRQVLFRFYDPRVMRAFLPVCHRDELEQFFGPITRIYCQGDDPGTVLEFTLNDDGNLKTNEHPYAELFRQQYGKEPASVGPLPKPADRPPLPRNIQRMRERLLRPN